MRVTGASQAQALAEFKSRPPGSPLESPRFERRGLSYEVIDGVLGVCPSCGATLTVVPGIQMIHRNGPLTLVDWKCVCGFMGRISYGRDWFKTKMAPAIRWWAKQEGAKPRTEQEIMMEEFVIDLAAVETVADLELYWRAKRGPKESRVD